MELLVVALHHDYWWPFCAAAFQRRIPASCSTCFELIYEFIAETISQVGVHHGEKFIYYIGTIFIFILSMNLIGLVPGLESPTNYVHVTRRAWRS